MHIITDEQWREHHALVRSLETAIVLLAKGTELMSTATTAALAKLDTLEAKVDKLLADTQANAAAALAADETDAATLSNQIDRIDAKIDAAAAAAPAPAA